MAINFEFQSLTHTLEDHEIHVFMNKIQQNLDTALNITLRQS